MANGFSSDQQYFELTMFTDAYVIRGQVATRQRRLTDVLNQAEHEFLVLTDVLLDEFGTRSVAVKADHAQVNLTSVLFAVGEATVDASPDLRTPKIAEQALISIPPFKIVGRIHLLPERDLRGALEGLTGRFIPVTDASYWSESVGEARKTAPIIAFNRSRAQILAPHRVVDPWEGIGHPTEASAGSAGPAAETPEPAAGERDVWGVPRT
jgi:hypothetical protein